MVIALTCSSACARWVRGKCWGLRSASGTCRLRTSSACSSRRRWRWRVAPCWRDRGNSRGLAPPRTCLRASHRSTSRWWVTRSPYERSVALERSSGVLRCVGGVELNLVQISTGLGSAHSFSPSKKPSSFYSRITFKFYPSGLMVAIISLENYPNSVAEWNLILWVHIGEYV